MTSLLSSCPLPLPPVQTNPSGHHGGTAAEPSRRFDCDLRSDKCHQTCHALFLIASHVWLWQSGMPLKEWHCIAISCEFLKIYNHIWLRIYSRGKICVKIVKAQQSASIFVLGKHLRTGKTISWCWFRAYLEFEVPFQSAFAYKTISIQNEHADKMSAAKQCLCHLRQKPQLHDE